MDDQWERIKHGRLRLSCSIELAYARAVWCMFSISPPKITDVNVHVEIGALSEATDNHLSKIRSSISGYISLHTRRIVKNNTGQTQGDETAVI